MNALTLLKRDSNTDSNSETVSCECCEIFTNGIYRTLPLTAAALIFFIFSSCKLRLYNLNSWIVVFVNRYFFTRENFNFDCLLFIKLVLWNRTCAFFPKFDQTKTRQISLYTLSNLFDSINLIKLIWVKLGLSPSKKIFYLL